MVKLKYMIIYSENQQRICYVKLQEADMTGARLQGMTGARLQVKQMVKQY